MQTLKDTRFNRFFSSIGLLPNFQSKQNLKDAVVPFIIQGAYNLDIVMDTISEETRNEFFEDNDPTHASFLLHSLLKTIKHNTVLDDTTIISLVQSSLKELSQESTK